MTDDLPVDVLHDDVFDDVVPLSVAVFLEMMMIMMMVLFCDCCTCTTNDEEISSCWIVTTVLHLLDLDIQRTDIPHF